MSELLGTEYDAGESPLVPSEFVPQHAPLDDHGERGHFSTDASDAVPVNERAASAGVWRVKVISANSDPMLVPERKGRVCVAGMCPTIYTLADAETMKPPHGFMISESKNAIDTLTGYQVNPGDSFEWDSEMALYIGPLPGNTDGVCQYVEVFSPRGGPVGN